MTKVIDLKLPCEHKTNNELYAPVMVPPEKPDRVWYIPVPLGYDPPYFFMNKKYDLTKDDMFHKCLLCGDYYK